MIYCLKLANSLSCLLAPEWCSPVELEQYSYWEPDPHPFSAKPPQRSSMNHQPGDTDTTPHRLTTCKPPDLWSSECKGMMEFRVGKLNLGPSAGVLIFFNWKGFFFLNLWLYITVWQMFLMDLREVQLRKSEFITFGFDTEHIPHIGRLLKHSFLFLKPDRGIKGLLFLFWHVLHWCLNLNSAQQRSALVMALGSVFHLSPPLPPLSLTSVSMVDAQLKSLRGRGHCPWQAAFTDLSVGQTHRPGFGYYQRGTSEAGLTHQHKQSEANWQRSLRTRGWMCSSVWITARNVASELSI